MLIIFWRVPVSPPVPTKLEEGADNRMVSGERTSDARIIFRAMRENDTVLDVRILKGLYVDCSAIGVIRQAPATGYFSIIERGSVIGLHGKLVIPTIVFAEARI